MIIKTRKQAMDMSRDSLIAASKTLITKFQQGVANKIDRSRLDWADEALFCGQDADPIRAEARTHTLTAIKVWLVLI